MKLTLNRKFKGQTYTIGDLYIVQIWHFFLVLGAVLKGNFISPGRNGGLGIDLFLAGTRKKCHICTMYLISSAS